MKINSNFISIFTLKEALDSIYQQTLVEIKENNMLDV